MHNSAQNYKTLVCNQTEKCPSIIFQCQGLYLALQLEEMSLMVVEIKKSLWRQDIEPLQIQNPIVWSQDWKYTVLRLSMFGAFYPNYFRKVT